MIPENMNDAMYFVPSVNTPCGLTTNSLLTCQWYKIDLTHPVPDPNDSVVTHLGFSETSHNITSLFRVLENPVVITWSVSPSQTTLVSLWLSWAGDSEMIACFRGSQINRRRSYDINKDTDLSLPLFKRICLTRIPC